MKRSLSQKFLSSRRQNEWFKSEFVELKKGDALNLPIEDESIDIAAQNCLYIF
jgi:ubiquinone/menaquinone biosynthesis C-methylase UbiE